MVTQHSPGLSSTELTIIMTEAEKSYVGVESFEYTALGYCFLNAALLSCILLCACTHMTILRVLGTMWQWQISQLPCRTQN